ncbi:hypothetical protein M5C99_17095 [Acidovorax sp. NCPPB 2350]|uniref:Uncharacterized protein n=1 Tax=Paracidovorax anthurii TaxID=78229 RepID=A0A328YM08_9BURK|nr:hypothetical protein [Paracidovorax anthurii]RAR74384.1 hypothetical protein AX018_106419 [Paracidovorax anthurii]WCM92061.1 hypothetical protein M5C99_17095 [Acidovorax sp. NCPPB 2350]
MDSPAHPAPARRPPWGRRLAWAAAAAAALAGAFALYAEPAFVVMLADQVWACF